MIAATAAALHIQRFLLKMNFARIQGDQIGQFLSLWVIVLLWAIF
jgi:hypothetical protein